jgi:hypothetical protein
MRTIANGYTDKGTGNCNISFIVRFSIAEEISDCIVTVHRVTLLLSSRIHISWPWSVTSSVGTLRIKCNVIFDRFQSKALRMITDAPWYVPNTVIRKDLKIPTVKHKISRYSYKCSKRFSVHPNELILNLQEPSETRRLRKNLPIDSICKC